MKPVIVIALTLAALPLVSCDKAKELASKASELKEAVETKKAKAEGTLADPELQKLVDQTDEGVMFRSDLPFPTRIDVRTTRKVVLSGRFFQASELGSEAKQVEGIQTTVTKLERAAGAVRYTLLDSGFSKPVVEGAETAPMESAEQPLPAAVNKKPVTFRKVGEKWRTDDKEGFRAVVLSKQLGPVFDDLLIDNSLAARPLWFPQRRIHLGEEMTLTGDTLKMLVAGKAKGTLKLKFEAIEAVEGHPCGVFSVTGDLSRRQFPDFEGNFTDEDMTIESGKLWLSLLYPIVLKEQLDTIQTIKTGGGGNLVARGQGSVKINVVREWTRPEN
ncbi:MAG: hypothetical protein H7A49_01070 [Akkermansiaceae bacterium]|nr:hypothetical protein [Akkermansiaceae bacterium]MCP5542475.1 hypothetical protein [Akkermansiaceae bacterium]MCP5545990.1 hypothetical protein [Akkermansiaceae bacterium]